MLVKIVAETTAAVIQVSISLFLPFVLRVPSPRYDVLVSRAGISEFIITGSGRGREPPQSRVRARTRQAAASTQFTIVSISFTSSRFLSSPIQSSFFLLFPDRISKKSVFSDPSRLPGHRAVFSHHPFKAAFFFFFRIGFGKNLFFLIPAGCRAIGSVAPFSLITRSKQPFSSFSGSDSEKICFF